MGNEDKFKKNIWDYYKKSDRDLPRLEAMIAVLGIKN